MADSDSGGGVGFVGLLTILFIAFKLLGVIDWSWAWVLAPVWIAWGFTALVVLVIMLFGVKTVKAKPFKL